MKESCWAHSVLNGEWGICSWPEAFRATWCHTLASFNHVRMPHLLFVGPFLPRRVFPTVDGHNPAPLGNHGKPFFIGIYRGGFRPSTVWRMFSPFKYGGQNSPPAWVFFCTPDPKGLGEFLLSKERERETFRFHKGFSH